MPFTTSIETSIFTKIARVAPIYRLVYNQLYQHLTRNNLLAYEQSGFRTLQSTLTPLLKNTDDWHSGLDNGQLVGFVLIDLSL